jgi:hypothetical protein
MALQSVKKDSTRERDVPLIFVLRRWCRDSNPGWLSQPLLWRVVLTSCTPAEISGLKYFMVSKIHPEPCKKGKCGICCPFVFQGLNMCHYHMIMTFKTVFHLSELFLIYRVRKKFSDITNGFENIHI